MSEIATTISAAVEEQDAATQKIAQSVVHASAGMMEVTENIQEVTQNAGTASEAAKSVLLAAEGMA